MTQEAEMKMKIKTSLRTAALILTVASALPSFSSTTAGREKPLKVLAIGNSFSICVLKEIPEVAKDLGCPLDFCSLYIPGCSLKRHAENLKKPDSNPYLVTWSYVSCPAGAIPFGNGSVAKVKNKHYGNIEKMLKADRWDVVTVQQASHLSWKPDSYEPYGTAIVEMIRKNAPQARIFVQQTWSYTPWDKRLKKWGIDQNGMFEKLDSAYRSFAAAHKLDVIRTGSAVQLFRRELPVRYADASGKALNDDVAGANRFKKLENGEVRFSGDAFHLNRKGEYLQALVWTAKLFGVDVTRCGYVPEYLKDSPATAELMKKIAGEVAK